MTTYKVEVPEPPNPDVFKLWDRDNDSWTREAGSNKWRFRGWGSVYEWAEVVATHGPLTDKPRVKVGDVITAEKAWELPPESVVWSNSSSFPEALTRFEDTYQSSCVSAFDVGDLLLDCGDELTVLRVGGGE